MFEPGHLHLANLPGLPGQPEFSIDLYYDVRKDPQQGSVMHFRMTGDVNGNSFEEEFEMRRDVAFNFASVATRIAAKHGLNPRFGPVVRDHKEYDLMFEDIREKLHAQSGEPVDLEAMLRRDF